MPKVIQQIIEKFKNKRKHKQKHRTQEVIDKEREDFFNSEDYIIQSTIFHHKNPDNTHRIIDKKLGVDPLFLQ